MTDSVRSLSCLSCMRNSLPTWSKLDDFWQSCNTERFLHASDLASQVASFQAQTFSHLTPAVVTQRGAGKRDISTFVPIQIQKEKPKLLDDRIEDITLTLIQRTRLELVSSIRRQSTGGPAWLSTSTNDKETELLHKNEHHSCSLTSLYHDRVPRRKTQTVSTGQIARSMENFKRDTGARVKVRSRTSGDLHPACQ